MTDHVSKRIQELKEKAIKLGSKSVHNAELIFTLDPKEHYELMILDVIKDKYDDLYGMQATMAALGDVQKIMLMEIDAYVNHLDQDIVGG